MKCFLSAFSRGLLTFMLIPVLITTGHAQNIGINSSGNDPHGSAMLDIESSSKGLLIPRVSLSSTSDGTTISSPKHSLLVYNTNSSITGGDGEGYYFNEGTTSSPNWVKLLSTASDDNDWERDGPNQQMVPANLSDSIGIGTSNPTNNLEVTDSILVRSSSTPTQKDPNDLALIRARYSGGTVANSDKLFGMSGLARAGGSIGVGSEVVGMHGKANVGGSSGSDAHVFGLQAKATVDGDVDDNSIVAGVYAEATAPGSFADTVFSGYFPNGNMYLADSLGIGLAAPTDELDVKGRAYVRGDESSTDNNDVGGDIDFAVDDNDSGLDSPDDGEINIMASEDSIVKIQNVNHGQTGWHFNDPGNKDLDFRVDAQSSDNLIRTDAGNSRVGVGTGSPQNQLHVSGGSNASTSDNTGYFQIGDQNGTNVVYDDNEILARNNGSSSTLYMQDAGGDVYFHDIMGARKQVIIKNSGDVGIGTGTPATDYKLHVWGENQTTENGLLIDGDGENNDTLMHIRSNSSASSFGENDTKFIVMGDGDVGIGTIDPGAKLDVNGDINCSGTSSCSDRRYKKNLTPIAQPLNRVLELQGVYYDWKREAHPDKNFSKDRQIGIIAQDLEKEYPELVSTGEDGYKYADYSRLTVVLLEATKAQQKTIEGLKSENQSLKETQAAQNARIDSLKKETREMREELERIKKQVGLKAEQ